MKYDISRQRILQISNIIRNVWALPKYTHSRLIVFLLIKLFIPFTVLFFFYSCVYAIKFRCDINLFVRKININNELMYFEFM